MDSQQHLFSDPDISFLAQAKLQARVLVPVLRAIRERIGREEADKLVADALRDWSREQFKQVARASQDTKLGHWQTIWGDVFKKIDEGFEMEVLQEDDATQDFNVTHCPYADYFQALDEPELGALLLCEQDVHLADSVGSDAVEFNRSQTIMGGAKFCDFRIRLHNKAPKSDKA